MADTEVKYVGLPLSEAVRLMRTDAQTGRLEDGTVITQEVRDALSQLANVLSQPRLQSEHYAFCWSLGCVIK